MSDSNIISNAGVIGSGTMGGGIAMAFANAGFPVTMVDTDAQALDRGMATIRRNYAQSVARGRISASEAEARLERIRLTHELGELAGVDIVTEAVFEDMPIKLDLIARLDGILRPDAIIASNTSTLDIDTMAAATRLPDRFVGMHYFSPAHVMKLLEIVRGRATSELTIARSVALAQALGKVPVVVGVCFGFVGNRMLFARAAESERTLLEGATPFENDAALTAFGFPMGQHAMMDLSGLDVEWRIRQPRGEVRPVSDRLVEMKRWGQKTGAGFYRYEEGNRTPLRDPEIEHMCRDIGAGLGFAMRSFTSNELLERQLYPLVNEGARLLDEGIAASAEDIDTIWRLGYGWPADKIGPMSWADTIGAATICKRLDDFAAGRSDASQLEPAPLLRRMAESQQRFVTAVEALTS